VFPLPCGSIDKKKFLFTNGKSCDIEDDDVVDDDDDIFAATNDDDDDQVEIF
jgi:hypothetical protein